MALIVYGDFNCPYSALASARVDELLAAGEEIEWRAVQHDASMPPDGVAMDGDAGAELQREIDEVHSLLRPDESFELRMPQVRPNTAEASRIYAADPVPEVRRRWFEWAWARSGEPAATSEDPDTAARWQREWDATEKKMVPMLVLPDGYISRGLGALKRLADMIADHQGATASSDTPA
jgi:predicted DsbA family dithiol-disulfide isomerase